MKRLFLFLGILLCAVIVGGAAYLGYLQARPPGPAVIQAPSTIAVQRGDIEQSVTAPGQLVNTREQTQSFAVAGRISEIRVQAGESVKAGAVLAMLDETGLRYTLQMAQANLASAQAKLNRTKTPPTEIRVAAARAAVASAQTAYTAAVAKFAHKDDQLTVAQANLDKMRIALEQAQSAYDRVAWQSNVGMLPEARSLQQATIDYESALASFNLTGAEINDSAVKAAAQTLAQARAALAELTAPVSPDEVAIDQASVDNALLAVQQAQEALTHTQLVAPFDGIVQSVHAGAGDSVGAGTAVLELLDPRAIQIRSTVTEQDYALVHAGQNAQLYFDALPALVVQGSVERVVPLRESSSSSAIYPIYIMPKNLPPGLAPGMTVDASVEIAKRENVLRLPRALVHASGEGTARVRVWADNRTTERTIRVGLRGDQYVEILDGLDEGELVVSR